MDIDSVSRSEKLSTEKLHLAQYLVAFVLLALGVGLWRLQVLGADNYRVLAEQNRVRKVPVLAPRGKIFDREGRIIVDNYPSVSCYLLREQVKNLDADLPLISAGLHIPLEQIQVILKRYSYAPKYQPLPLKQDITPDEQAFVEAHRAELPELETLDEQRRLYPRDGFMAHAIGYVGEISENDLNQSKFAYYSPGDVVGKSGVEETYDSVLRGTDGSRDVVVNSHGKEVGMMGQELAIPGKDVRLTIDLDVQRAAEQALEGKIGAIVAMDPHTGEILAMVSRPTFDPQPICGATHQVLLAIHPRQPRSSAAEQDHSGTTRARIYIQGHHDDGGIAGKCRTGHARAVQRRRDLLRSLLCVRQTPRWRGHSQRAPVLLRHLLLHAREPPRYRHHGALRQLRRHWCEDRCRSSRRSRRRHAVGSVEDEDAARQVVRGARRSPSASAKARLRPHRCSLHAR